MRLKTSDVLLFLLLFVFVASFPVDLIKVDYVYQLLIQIGLRSLLLTYYIYLIVKNRIKIFGMVSWRHIALCIPFLLACVSNIIASGIDGGFVVGMTLTSAEFSLYIILVLFSVISEEIIFRLFIHNTFANTSSIKRILFSAGIFALMHLVNLVNVSSVNMMVSVLVQAVYAFGLGILLGFIYEYGHSLTICVIFHLLFNLLNDVLYTFVLGGYINHMLTFYLTAVVIAVILAGYVFAVYKLYYCKLDKYFRA